MKQFFTVTCCLLALCTAAQQKQVINTCGQTYTAVGTQLRASVGEPIVNSFSNDTITLSAGFLYGSTAGKAIVIDTPSVITNFAIYPNPTSSKIYVKGNTANIRRVQLTNIIGQLVMDTKFSNNVLPVAGLAKGIYFGKLLDAQNKMIGFFKMIKQ